MERNIEQLKKDTMTLKEIERDEINNLDLSDDLKNELLEIVDKMENNIGDMNDDELSELAEYMEQRHKINKMREDLTKEMLEKIGIDTGDVSKVSEQLLEKGYDMVKLIDDSNEDKVIYRYSINNKSNNEVILYFYEIEEINDDYTNIKFSYIMEEK